MVKWDRKFCWDDRDGWRMFNVAFVLQYVCVYRAPHGLTTESVGEFTMESSCHVVGRTLVSLRQHQKIKQMFLKIELIVGSVCAWPPCPRGILTEINNVLQWIQMD